MRYVLPFILLLVIGCTDTPDSESAPAASDTAELSDPTDVPDDLAALESAYVETPLRNEHVDAHRVALPAGAAIASHEGGPRVVYSLGAYTLRLETDGTSETRSFAEGDVHYHDGGMHAIENTGSTEAAFVIFERRDASLPAAEAQGETEVTTPSEGTTAEIIFDNEFVEVHRIALQPSAQLPPHRGFARAIYSLSGYTVEFTGPDGTREQQFEPSELHFHDPGEHTVENAGDTVAEFLVVEFKR